uniref:beta-N-acetylhexosaminidase n=1 Tax=Fagus sylvatica TaxID=28930 RepID=A0A2N9H2G8_FAGSY
MFGIQWTMPCMVLNLLACWKRQGLTKDQNIIWNAIPGCLMWLIWRERNQRAFEDIERHTMDLKLNFIQTLMEWKAVLSSQAVPSIITFIDELGGGVAQQVVAAGLRCIVSNQDKWYLDHLDTTWQQFYMNEPLTNITNPNQQKLVLGGEVCMWGEHIDGSDIEQTIWPRAAAAAERLWTPYDNLAKDPRQVTGRLAHFRCLLNQRGIAAAPLAGPGRVAPVGPGSCYTQ